MKTRKTYTGTYCCLNCCTEYRLSLEPNLKCEECGGMLVKGELDDYGPDGYGGYDDEPDGD